VGLDRLVSLSPLLVAVHRHIELFDSATHQRRCH
jgi:hypothetical protein